jgi:hypothetical protein
MQTSYPASFRLFILNPGVPALSSPPSHRDTLKVVLANFFRQLEMWRYDYSSLPRRGLSYDPGVPREEASRVYLALDTVFRKIFPELGDLSREDAAVHMETFLRSIYANLRDGGEVAALERGKLVSFMHELDQELEKPPSFSL